MASPEDTPDIIATGSRIVYENKWMRVREDAIRRRDGSAGIYGVIEKDDFVVVVAAAAGAAKPRKPEVSARRLRVGKDPCQRSFLMTVGMRRTGQRTIRPPGRISL